MNEQLLVQINEQTQTIYAAQVKRDELIRQFVENGGTWQELARTNKFAALKLCAESEGIRLTEADRRVNEFLESLSAK